MVEKTSKTDPIINLVANLTYRLYDPQDNDPELAKGFLKRLWRLVMEEERELPSPTELHIDRCSEGGFAIHYHIGDPKGLNSFIKRAPSKEWAEQTRRFYKRYMEDNKDIHKNFKMAISLEPFYYDDMILYLTHFVNGMDLDSFLLKTKDYKDKYSSYIEAIAKRSLDDLVFWQKDSKDIMFLPKPSRESIIKKLKSNIHLAFEHSREFGLVDIVDDELLLLDNALDLFDRLTLNDSTIVPIVDYCPKNMGIRTEHVSPDLDEVIGQISTKPKSRKPDHDKIAEQFYHWDPAAKWGHFLEDFFAFFNSYEFMGFENRKGITSLDDRYERFLSLKYGKDEKFKEWVNSLDLGRGWRNLIDRFARKIFYDNHLIKFYRSTRKSDLTLTQYAWKNERISKYKTKELHELTKKLLPLHIFFYSRNAVGAIKSFLDENLEMTKQKLSNNQEKIYQEKIKEDNRALKYFIKAYERDLASHQKTVVDALYLLNMAKKLRKIDINYEALKEVKDPSEFSKSTFTR